MVSRQPEAAYANAARLVTTCATMFAIMSRLDTGSIPSAEFPGSKATCVARVAGIWTSAWAWAGTMRNVGVSSPFGGESRPPLDASTSKTRPPGGLDRDPAEPKPESSGVNRLQLGRFNAGSRCSCRGSTRGSATPTVAANRHRGPAQLPAPRRRAQNPKLAVLQSFSAKPTPGLEPGTPSFRVKHGAERAGLLMPVSSLSTHIVWSSGWSNPSGTSPRPRAPGAA